MHVVQFYHEAPALSTKKPPRITAKSLLLTRYYHLLRYPLPSPKDEALINVIGTSLAQALAALAALVCQSPGNEAFLDTFALAIEGDDGILMWRSFMPREHADAMLARAHRALAVTFASSNTPPAVLLRLRTWALRCLLLKTTLDSDSFWSQATNYLASYGKSILTTGS